MCAIQGCENQPVCRGWCDKHYTRFKRHGDPEHVTQIDTRGLSVEGKLRAHGWNVTESYCWEWAGSRKSKRYGTLHINGRYLGIHRLAYETWVGPIPEGLVIRHKCDNTWCINPDHLETGTHADNSRDMVARNRQRDQKGSNHNMSRVTEEEVISIRKRYSEGGVFQTELAEEYGLTQTAISAIIRRKTWRHI